MIITLQDTAHAAAVNTMIHGGNVHVAHQFTAPAANQKNPVQCWDDQLDAPCMYGGEWTDLWHPSDDAGTGSDDKATPAATAPAEHIEPNSMQFDEAAWCPTVAKRKHKTIKFMNI